MDSKLLATLLPLLALFGTGLVGTLYADSPRQREINRGKAGGAEGFQGTNVLDAQGNIVGRNTGQGGGIGPLLTALVQQQQQQPPVAGLGPSLGQLLTNMQAGQQFQNAAGLLQLPTLPQRGQRQ